MPMKGIVPDRVGRVDERASLLGKPGFAAAHHLGCIATRHLETATSRALRARLGTGSVWPARTSASPPALGPLRRALTDERRTMIVTNCDDCGINVCNTKV